MFQFFWIAFGQVVVDRLTQSPIDRTVFRYKDLMVARARNPEDAVKFMNKLETVHTLEKQGITTPIKRGDYIIKHCHKKDDSIVVTYEKEGQSKVCVQAYFYNITGLTQVTTEILAHYYELVTSLKNSQHRLWNSSQNAKMPLETQIHVPKYDPILKQKALEQMPSRIPLDQKEKLAETVAIFISIISKETNIYQIETLLHAFGRLSAEQRQKLVELAADPKTKKVFTENFMHSLGSVTLEIRKISADNLRSVFETAARFISERTPIDKITKLLNILAALSSGKTKNPAYNLSYFLEKADLFISEETDIDEIQDILVGLMYTSPEHHQKLVELKTNPKTKKVFTQNFTGNPGDAIGAIRDIPAQNLQSVFETAAHFISETTHIDEITQLLSGLNAMSAEQR